MSEICRNPGLTLLLPHRGQFAAWMQFLLILLLSCTVSAACYSDLTTVKPRYLATVCLGLNDGERRGWRLNEGSRNEPVDLSVLYVSSCCDLLGLYHVYARDGQHFCILVGNKYKFHAFILFRCKKSHKWKIISVRKCAWPEVPRC